MKKLQAIGAAFAAASAAGIFIYVGLQHGMQGYDAHQAKQKKLDEQKKKREERNKKGGPRR
jgi:hypothetical protein